MPKDCVMKPYIIVVLIMIFTSHAYSQDTLMNTFIDMSLEELLQVKVYSASRTEQSFLESSANVSVITSQQIALSGASSITDLLRYIPGLDVMSGFATGTDVAGRGLNQLENSKLLVMVNGQRVNNDFTGAVKWLQIPVMLHNIERIEILTSPLSSLYGANSFSALINIITKPIDKLNTIDFQTKIGQNNSQELWLGYGKSFSKLHIRYDANFSQSEGWGNRDSSEIKEEVLPYVIPGTTDTISGKIKDWYKLLNTTFDVKYELDSKNDFIFSGGLNYGQVAVPELTTSLKKVSNNYYDTRNGRLLLEYRNKLSKNSAFNTRLSYSQWDDFGGVYQCNTKRYSFEAIYSVNLKGRNNITTGINSDYIEAKALSIDKNRIDNLYAFFIQDEIKLYRWMLMTAGVRLDKHTNLNLQFSPRLSINIIPAKNHYLRFGFGQAFKKPTFLENYFHLETGTTSIVLGMVNANGIGAPERINSFNIDYQNVIGKVNTRVSVFKNFVTDLITTKKVTPYNNYNLGIFYENRDKVNITGGEVEIKANPYRFIHLFANASLQTIEYKTPIVGQKLSVPELKGNYGFQLNFSNGFYADAVVHYTGVKEAQYAYINTLPDNSPEYYFMKFPAVGILNLNAGYIYTIKKAKIEFSVKCFNVFNTRNIQYAVFDSGKAYFGLDTPARNYTPQMKTAFENRNALNDRKILLSLKISVL